MRKIAMTLFVFLISFSYENCLFAFIRIDSDGSAVYVPQSDSRQSNDDVTQLITDLERITGLKLFVEKGYIRVTKNTSIVEFQKASLPQLANKNIAASQTAQGLFLSALQSSNVYKIRIDRDANLGRVLKGDLIELDFMDQKYLRFRGVPAEVFSTSMIFFHELVHRHLALPDPTIAEIRMNRNAKGKTVEFMNRIEKELNLPERLHYFPRKNPVRGSTGFCIFFGDEGKRIEIDAEIFRPLLQSGKNQGYTGLLRN